MVMTRDCGPRPAAALADGCADLRKAVRLRAACSGESMKLAHLAEAVLGPGKWAPEPERWNDGTERGQF